MMLDAHKFNHWYIRFSYEKKGYTQNDGYMMGDTPEGNKNAKTDSEQRIIDLLDQLSGKLNN